MTLQLENVKEPQLRLFFEKACAILEKSESLLKQLEDGTYLSQDIEVLAAENAALYEDVLPAQYATSFANPVYACEVFGKEKGQVLTFVYAAVRQSYSASFKGDREAIERNRKLLETIYETTEVACWVTGIREMTSAHLIADYTKTMNETYGGKQLHYQDVTAHADLSDVRYLYRYGVYITPFEVQTATFLENFDAEALSALATSIAKAYVAGFVRDNKDRGTRSAVRIIANAGQERLTRLVIKALAEMGLEGYVATVVSTEFNAQYAFDHRFDKGLYLDAAFNDAVIAAVEKAAENSKTALSNYSGVLFVERFGEEPFSPVNNDARIKLDEAQQGLHQALQIAHSQLIERYIPETERSFCIVAFPTPEIGPEFEAIFKDTVRINQMDSAAYESIQQVIIDALDLGEFVHVKGGNGNETDIKVKLKKIENPEKETNFVNCVADVNIPVGEVFTSPVLKDTTGLLHVDTVYLNNFNYENLRLEFVDGYIDAYSCTNFESVDKCQEYVRENLLFPHQTLPLGEFAIGTNTLAYVIGEKYGIVDKMPILIVEKMGPHFAIGDTCFSWGEDHPVYNPTDGKEIIARDNERSILRKEDVSKAYTNCHTDITIPYDSLEHITVLTASGEAIPIIENGRFVLPGTEALNKPFDEA